MKRTAWFGLLLVNFWPPVASAQLSIDHLNDTQKMGRQAFTQSCGECRLLKPAQINAVISYVHTVPVQAAAAARRSGGE